MQVSVAAVGDTTQSLFSSDFFTWSVIGAAIFALIFLIMSVSIWRYRAGRGHEPSVNRKLEKVEFGYFAVVAAIASFLIYTSISTNNSRMTGKPSLAIAVTGYQWCWRFSYEGTPLSITGSCSHGHYPVFEVPQGKVVRFDVTSEDVVHGFWIPAIRYKIYAYPNHVNHFEDSFTKLGTFPGRCAVFCGLYHHSMDFYVKVVTPAKFAAWLHREEPLGDIAS